ncbi:MAG TPA: GNAT family N-acetyltransferase [Acidimicrobiales bacterium]|nr:GNAT family N-acetyltransferase [Acidimicrobiales bacterium]
MTAGAVVPTPGVRAALEADVPFVVALAEAAAASLHGSRGAELMLLRESTPPDATTIVDWLHAGDVAVFIGVLDGVPVGAAAAHVEVLTGGTLLAVVTMLYVDEAARAVGVGEALLNALVEWARAAGCTSIDAYALPGERITKNFFEAAGFKARLLTVSHRLDEPTAS